MALAIKAFVANPDIAIPFLQARLLQAVAKEAPFDESLTSLDCDDFATRERVTQQLEKAGAEAEFALKLFLDFDHPLEAKRRAELCVDKIQTQREARVLKLVQDLGNDNVDE